MELGRTAQAMLPVALVLLALTQFDSPALGGALTFLSIFPGLVVAPFVGAFIDRVGSVLPIRFDYTVGAIACAANRLIVAPRLVGHARGHRDAPHRGILAPVPNDCAGGGHLDRVRGTDSDQHGTRHCGADGAKRERDTGEHMGI